MEKDSKTISEVFNSKYADFFKSEDNKTIERSWYALGVLLRSNHLKEKKIQPYNPKNHELINEWNLETWQRATWGTDDTKPAEVYEKEADETDLSHYDYLVSNAVKYHRPAWVIFGLLGMMQGQLNCAYFEAGSLQQGSFDKNDYISAASYLSSDFLSTYSSDLLYLFSYFDEAGCTLVIDTIKASLIIVEG